MELMVRNILTKVVVKLRNERLLLVDDEKGILTMLETLLKKEGFHRIAMAATGDEALRLVETTPFDLIVLDVMLPGYGWIRVVPTNSQAYVGSNLVPYRTFRGF